MQPFRVLASAVWDLWMVQTVSQGIPATVVILSGCLNGAIVSEVTTDVDGVAVRCHGLVGDLSPDDCGFWAASLPDFREASQILITVQSEGRCSADHLGRGGRVFASTSIPCEFPLPAVP